MNETINWLFSCSWNEQTNTRNNDSDFKCYCSIIFALDSISQWILIEYILLHLYRQLIFVANKNRRIANKHTHTFSINDWCDFCLHYTLWRPLVIEHTNEYHCPWKKCMGKFTDFALTRLLNSRKHHSLLTFSSFHH